jgi:hypothetical protein
MEPLLVLRGVHEVSVLAQPSAPETVTQRAFDDARARSVARAELPPARRITEQLALPWREVLAVAHAPANKHSFLLGRKETEASAQTWLTPEYVAFALRLVARRLNTNTLTPGEYRVERERMLREDRARWLHGGQLLLPNEDQIRAAAGSPIANGPVAGSWDAALRLAGLGANERVPRKITQRILLRVEVIERFHDHYGEKPSAKAVEAFARGNKLALSAERGRSWGDIFAEWEQQRRERGLPAPRVVRRAGGRGHKAPDYSHDVGAARPGEEPYKRKWADADACAAWIKRYLAQLGPNERSTVRGYDDWARTQPGAPRASRFGQHGGWEALRRRAQEQVHGT